MVECRTPEREVRGSRPTAAVLCPWARHFTPRKYWLITQEAMAPSRHDWKIVDWDVKPQHNQPTTCAPIHSIDLDAVKMEARLPQDKLSELKLLLQSNIYRRKIKFKDLQSLLGHLNFACRVIKPGRCFLRRLYDLTCGTHRPDHFIRLNKAARADLKVWCSFSIMVAQLSQMIVSFPQILYNCIPMPLDPKVLLACSGILDLRRFLSFR